MQQEAARKAHQEKYDKWSIENAQADEKFNEMMRRERKGGQTKPCPKCKQAITKNHGCDHMTCPCGHEFYWSTAVWKSNCRVASPPLLNRGLHAIDATPARRRRGVVSHLIDVRTGL